MKILFLDIDGVLNGHRILKAAGCCGIDVRCIGHLNHVLRVTSCRLVLSSAWRYLVLPRPGRSGSAMTLDGFWYLLRTHGLTNQGRGNPFVGATMPDEQCAHCGCKRRRRGSFNADGEFLCPGCGQSSTRGDQIAAWLDHLRGVRTDVESYAVVDDLDLGIRAAGHPFVQTDGRHGLTRGRATKLIELLGKCAA